MQALKLEAISGWRWVGTGYRTFRKQPFSFAALLFFYWLLLIGSSAVIEWLAQGIGLLLPFLSVGILTLLGGLLVTIATPALTVGFLQACRIADSGVQVHPGLLFAPFRSGRQTVVRLLALGAVQVVALVCVVFLANGPSAFQTDTPSESKPAATVVAPPTAAAGQPADAVGLPTAEQQEAMRREAFARLKLGLAYLPIALLMWYAPMLVAWHGLPPGKAIFFSIVAVWRNRSAFIVYGAAWLAIWMVLSIGVGIVLGVMGMLGLGSFAALLAVPLVMLLLTCMYCSVYPTYSTVFVVEPSTPS